MFEIEDIDLYGRLGKLYTGSGTVRTPALTPVINPTRSVLEPKEIAGMGYELLMTNSYIIRQNYGDLALEAGVHGVLGVDTPVMTDSGAYQLMVYGRVKVEPREIVEYQAKLGSDIGVILDIPTRIDTPYERVKAEVEETLRRAEEALSVDRGDMLLVGPVQGGLHLNLVAYSASRLSKMPFDVYAVGGPTQIMENYMFSDLVKLVMTARLNLPWPAPLHLFGAGHPIMIPLAVAMGVDTFDSASYALYARDDRLLTERGTVRLSELEELPCTCPVCSKYTAKELREAPKQERERLIARHNLYVILREVKRTRQAVKEGRLWELLEEKARTHPSMAEALRTLSMYSRFLAEKHPVTRGKIQGIFYYGRLSRYRPETVRHIDRLKERHVAGSDTLLLFQETKQKPFTRAGLIKEVLGAAPNLWEKADMAVLSLAFSIIPLELDGVYPLSQYTAARPLLEEAYNEVAADLHWYVANKGYRKVVLVYYDLPGYILYRLEEALRAAGARTFKIHVKEYEKALAEPGSLAESIAALLSA